MQGGKHKKTSDPASKSFSHGRTAGVQDKKRTREKNAKKKSGDRGQSVHWLVRGRFCTAELFPIRRHLSRDETARTRARTNDQKEKTGAPSKASKDLQEKKKSRKDPNQKKSLHDKTVRTQKGKNEPQGVPI